MPSHIAPSSSPHVLIVGAGPSGLVAALSLVKNGIPVRIIEKTLSQPGQRGAGIHPRSLELFEFLGVYDDISKLALPMPLIRAYKLPGGRETFADIPIIPEIDPTPGVPYPNSKLLGQESVRNILLKHLKDAGCSVELGTELKTLEDRGDEGVHTSLVHYNVPGEKVKEESANFEYVIGADGAKGVVRKLLGLTFVGQKSPENFIVGDVVVEGLSTNHWHHWGTVVDTLVSLRPTEIEGVYHLILGGSNLKDHEKILASDETLVSFIKQHTGHRDDFNIKRVIYVSHFAVQTRMTETFDKGRVFIVGDACHVHSPFGAQGMNSSIQDSFNLCWKLALVLKNQSPPSLLSTYTTERIPVIAEMLALASHFLNQSVREAHSADGGWAKTEAVKQLGVNYRSSPIVLGDEEEGEEGKEKIFGSAYLPDPSGFLHAGDRAPDASGLRKLGDASGHPDTRLFKLFDPTRHTILLFADRVPNALPSTPSVLSASYPHQLVRIIIIASPIFDSSAASSLLDGGFEVFEDGQGHANGSYFKGESPGGSGFVVIRPDGVVGAKLKNLDKVEDYFKGIFNHSVAD